MGDIGGLGARTSGVAAGGAEPSDDRAEERLLESLGRMGEAVVAFSGGVDSTYLAWAAHRALGGGAHAVTAVSPSLAVAMREEIPRLAASIGIALELIETRELEDPRYRANAGDRCFWCKDGLYRTLGQLARERGWPYILDGTNRDDLGDHRPGREAAVARGVRSPLIEAELDKAAIRRLSRRAGLPTWDRPASPCLASRIPYGMTVDGQKLAMIDRAETAVRGLGFRELRVRHLGSHARIEIASGELGRALATGMPERLVDAVRTAGFASAELSREPFRSGSLNDALTSSAAEA